jgi:hypothetical protein
MEETLVFLQQEQEEDKEAENHTDMAWSSPR